MQAALLVASLLQNSNPELDIPEAQILTLRLSGMNGRIVFSTKYKAVKGLQTGDAALPAGALMMEVLGKEGLLFAEPIMAIGQ